MNFNRQFNFANPHNAKSCRDSRRGFHFFSTAKIVTGKIFHLGDIFYLTAAKTFLTLFDKGFNRIAARQELLGIGCAM